MNDIPDLMILGFGDAYTDIVANSELTDKHYTVRNVTARCAMNRLIADSITERGFRLVSMPSDRQGIILSTKFGDELSKKWRGGYRIRPYDLGASVHNGPAGYCSIAFGLKGPQLTIVHGLLAEVAAEQIVSGRADCMFMLYYDDPGLCRASVIVRRSMVEDLS